MLGSGVRWVLRLALPALFLAGILALGQLPVGQAPSQGMVRLIGRMVGARVRVCRDLTREELAKIPKHMQLGGQTCEQSPLPYRLQVWIGDQLRVDENLRPAGIRGDRPLYVQQEWLLEPGIYPLRIRFAPGPARPPTGGEAGLAERALAQALGAAAHFDLDELVDVRAGRVFLLELDEPARRWMNYGNGR